MPTTMNNDEFLVPDFAIQQKIRAGRKAEAAKMVDEANKSIETGKPGRMVGPYWIANDERGDVVKSGVGSFLGAMQDREAQTEAEQLANIRAELLKRMPSQTRTETTPGLVRPAGNNPDEEGSYQAPPTTRQVLNEAFGDEATRWGGTAMQVPGLEQVGKSFLAEGVTAPGRRMEKQEAREARAGELEAARVARQQEAQANRDWREAEANRNRDDKEAARQLSADDRAAQAREARADRAANAAAIRAEKTAQVKPLTPKQKETQRGFTDLEKSLDHYESMLQSYDPQSGQALSPTSRAALESAFTDVQMKMKNLYELGAPQAGDLRLLEQSLANPTSIKGTLSGVAFGSGPMLAKTGELRTLLENSRESFDSQMGVTSPRAERKPAQSASGKVSAPQAAIDMLKKNPALAPAFKAKYGYLP